MEPQQQNPVKKIISIAVVVLLILSGIYFFFFNKAPAVLTKDEFGNPVQMEVVGQDLLDLLSQLKSVKLDNALFAKPAFVQLTDYSIPLPSQPQGRTNPFSSYSGGAQTVFTPVSNSPKIR